MRKPMINAIKMPAFATPPAKAIRLSREGWNVKAIARLQPISALPMLAHGPNVNRNIAHNKALPFMANMAPGTPIAAIITGLIDTPILMRLGASPAIPQAMDQAMDMAAVDIMAVVAGIPPIHRIPITPPSLIAPAMRQAQGFLTPSRIMVLVVVIAQGCRKANWT